MAFNRKIMPRDLSQHDLVADMVSIGINLGSVSSAVPVNIEDVLFSSSLDAIENEDFRVLSLLTTWLGIHFAAVNVDRLAYLIASNPAPKFRAYWASIASWLQTDGRFLKIRRLYVGSKIDLLSVGTDFQISRYGEDNRFSKGFLRVPGNLLRDRKSDILSPPELAKKLRTYYNRMLMGPSYRADMWTEIERNRNLSTAELARRAYGSFATAWRVKNDWDILHPAHG